MIKYLTNTTAGEVDKNLVSIRETGGAFTLGRVLTLVIVTPADHMEEPITAAVQASLEHPCRVIVLATDPEADDDTLDAEIRVGRDAGAGEVVILHARGQVVSGVDTLITPLLLPDAPIVTWWPSRPPAAPSQDVLGRMSQRRITDALTCEDPKATLKRLRRGYQQGDTDLNWPRLTAWRGLLATAVDVPPLSTPSGVTVVGDTDHPAVILMTSWLEVALGLSAQLEPAEDGYVGLREVRLHREDGDIVISREDDETVVMTLPGEVTDQRVTMTRPTLWECLSQELRRLDPDEVYGEVLAHAFSGISDCSEYAIGKPAPRDVVCSGVDQLVEEAADTAVAALRDAIAERQVAHLVLTGGTVGSRVAAALPAAAKKAEIDLSAVHLWWGDERFVADDSSERNDHEIYQLLDDALDIPAGHVHRMPSADSGMSLDDAAAWYAQQLAVAGGETQFRTRGAAFFDVLMLGMGPDGHVASLFPDHPDQRCTDRVVTAVRNSPKPPPERISLTFSALNSARTVMLLVAGEEKADAVLRGHGEPTPHQTPASSVRGLDETIWFLDEASASKLGS
ncbi:6-phosphogluconolactonase [Devriesea agamarum]|uniref:6-phosphogluconolactonase n=1 Tax=Devriesea agamarum TaxID=472569 RepID=UPI00071C2EA3|nr:6-phosphogluconolactonase [Devriesea agamarum]